MIFKSLVTDIWYFYYDWHHTAKNVFGVTKFTISFFWAASYTEPNNHCSGKTAFFVDTEPRWQSGIKPCPQMTTKVTQWFIAPSSSNTTSLEAMTLHWQSWHISGGIQAWKVKVPFSLPSKIAALDLWDTTVYLKPLCWLQQCCSKFTLQVLSPGMLYWVSAARSLLESHGLVCSGIPERALSQSVIVWL